MSSLGQVDSQAGQIAAAKGGERVSLADIENAIADCLFFTGQDAADIHRRLDSAASIAPGTVMALSLLSVCIVVLKNGFTVIGKSACADPKNFDPAFGRHLAYEDAIRQIWPLMGFNLRQRLHERAQFDQSEKTGPQHPSSST